eukprot:CAMPEP_0194224342 /NCGR_PEP_ID=MMETSP0156-20130528/37215_1 /TAXON_ID=33649 /ORGANISM="Thalassionema nitzschioides, Strain L26-B" /LENGTH=590 /DNA_ID=CAMNT_0038955865 /DNA_START=68 /DNA_END=1840 /DNA_ORIENTATION=+
MEVDADGERSVHDINLSLKSNEKAVKVFLAELDTIESTGPEDAASLFSSAASHLVDVKSTERDIVHRLYSSAQARNTQRDELERQKMILKNLTFEKKYLQTQLSACKEYPTPNLEQMGRAELDDEKNTADMVLNQFLCGSSDLPFQDIGQKNIVEEKLHKELNARGTLKRELDKLQKDLTKRKRLVVQEKAFLKDIPKKLDMIERSSVPLQKFFQSSTATPTLHLIGSDRKKRLDLARALPGPLYSLFVQFQAHLDNEPEVSVTLEIAQYTKGKNASDNQVLPGNQVVQLSFAIPNIQSSDATDTAKRKRVTIEFAFVHKYGLVTAKASGSQDKIKTFALLEYLFPDDCGTWVGRPDDTTSLPGKPYHWCNFVAGLHLSGPHTADPNIHLSTKAVLRGLRKRVEANASLTQQILLFENRKVVAHPSLLDEMNISDCSTKLGSWTAAQDQSNKKKTERMYDVTIKHSTKSLSAKVTVDWCHYPAILPRWSLGVGEEAWATKHGSASKLVDGTNLLYSQSTAEIERKINSDFEKLVDCDDQSTFNWIISHQLITLIKLWDQSLQNSGRGVNSGATGNNRLKKGRNRVNADVL